jgi:hypothetical protein
VLEKPFVDYHLLTAALGNQSWSATAVRLPKGESLSLHVLVA